MDKTMKAFAQAVRRRRSKLGISQEALAEKADIDRTYVSLIERGKRSVTIGVAKRIAKALGLPLSKLIKEAEKEN